MNTKIKYLLTVWDEGGNKELLQWKSDTPFPRIEKGDLIDAGPFYPHSDSGSSLQVISMELLLLEGSDSREIEISLRTRLISRHQKEG